MTYLFQRNDKEGPSAGALRHDGEELGIDRAEMVVVDVLGNWNPIKAVLSVRHFPIDISKL